MIYHDWVNCVLVCQNNARLGTLQRRSCHVRLTHAAATLQVSHDVMVSWLVQEHLNLSFWL